MALSKPKILILVFLIIGGLILFYVDSLIKQNESERRKLRLENTHSRVVKQFEFAINNFAILIAGIKNYVENSPVMPDASMLQEHINDQLSLANNDQQLIISYLDTLHIFQYIVSRSSIDPAGLTGQSLKSFRNKEEIDNLEKLLKNDRINIFRPLNLKEKWLGLPFNFRVKRKGKVIGYMAPLLDLKVALDIIYEGIDTDEFAIRFQTEDDYEFDRQGVFDGSILYSTNIDDQSFRNFNLNEGDLRTDVLELFGSKIRIGLAYKEEFKTSSVISILIAGWYLTFVLFIFLLFRQMIKFRTLYKVNKLTNQILQKHKTKVIDQNNQLNDALDVKNKLFSIIGHDLKSPLNNITGVISLLKMEEIKDSNLKKMVDSLEKLTIGSSNLLDNLLKWSSLQVGNILFKPENQFVYPLIKEVKELIQLSLESKQIRLEVNIDSDTEAYFDYNMISAVVRNILTNSIKFSKEHGIIIVSLKIVNNEKIMSIKDEGVGMDETEKQLIFTIDKRNSKLGTSGEIGHGLGLVLCKDFVEKHGGKIWFESELNSGSCFYFSLPDKI